MWRCVNLVQSFLPLVVLSTFWSVVYAQSDTDGPCKTCPIECIGRQCPRYWWTSMWGFIVTLVVLTMDIWGATKATEKSTLDSIIESILKSTLDPLAVLWDMLVNTMSGLAMVANLREALGDEVIAPRYPWSKSHMKIISGSKIIVNLSPNVYPKIHNLKGFDYKVDVEDLSEALVIGFKLANSNQFNVQLSDHGKLALLRSKVLPPYDELKFLRGNSSLGMAIASAQAIGYIYGVVVRCVQGLQVSPIEAIACVLNMVILMKGVLHNFASLSHRPLLLYLQLEEEAKLIEECKIIQNFDFDYGGRLRFATSTVCGVFLAMGVYFTYNFVKSLNGICVVSIILFEVGLLSGGIFGIIWNLNYDILDGCLLILILLLNLVGYVLGLVATFKYWKVEDFDVRSSNFMSQVLPYIG